MKKNNIIYIITGIILVVVAILFLTKENKPLNQTVYEETLLISKKYLSLRYKTDNILVNAKDYKDYDTWNKEMTSIINDWKALEKNILELEKDSDKLSKEKVTFNLIENVYAYDAKEVQRVIESAPMGKQIRTLAKHFGVDVKKAQLILNQSQAMVTSEAWTEAGDTFEKLEHSAIQIKDTAKVVGFVGSVVVTGGATAAAGSSLATAALVVTGVDLTLEITEDSAYMAYGNNNKITAIARSARKITEPIAAVLSITQIPNNLVKGIDKVNAVMFGVEQFSEAVQEGKVIGVNLSDLVDKEKSSSLPVTVNVMEPNEVDKWIEDNKINNKTETKEEIEEILEINKTVKEENNKDAKEENKSEEVPTGKGRFSYSEWDEWGDADSRYKDDLLNKFGNPDVTTAKSGKEMWVYYDLVYNSSGNVCSVIYSFYSTDQTATRRCVSRENIDTILENN